MGLHHSHWPLKETHVTRPRTVTCIVSLGVWSSNPRSEATQGAFDTKQKVNKGLCMCLGAETMMRGWMLLSVL